MSTKTYDDVRQRLLDRARQTPSPNGDGHSLPPLGGPLGPSPVVPASSAGEGPLEVDSPSAAAERPAFAVPSRRDIHDRLVRRFGWGAKPAARRALYKRLCDLVELHGERAMDAIAEAAAQAAGAHSPGRYFCKVVNAKLRERGVTLSGSDGVGDDDFFGRAAEGGAA